MALSKYFDVHVYCMSPHVAICQQDPRTASWNFHGIPFSIPKGSTAWWKDWYPEWRRLVIDAIQQDLPTIQPVGLHHPTPGSFRILPAYHTLGIPYSLGPLGGGEYAPARFLRSAGLPLKTLTVESLRPLINHLSVCHPWSRPILKGAEHAIATTQESAGIVRFGGSDPVTCAFPDVFEPAENADPMVRRTAQQSELKDQLHLMFSGRSLWWKGGHLVLEVLAETRRRNMEVHVTMLTEGPVGAAWKRRADALGLQDQITWSHFVPRAQLLEYLSAAHVYVYPTMHDSSSSALPEAYSTGLPSLTLGIGGAGTASGEHTGLNLFKPTASEWVTCMVDQLQRWQEHPDEWLASCQGAYERSKDFSQEAIEQVVERELVPLFGA